MVSMSPELPFYYVVFCVTSYSKHQQLIDCRWLNAGSTMSTIDLCPPTVQEFRPKYSCYFRQRVDVRYNIH